MKAISCPQCGSLIRHILPRQPIAECDYCGAKVVTDQRSAPPELFEVEAAKFRAPVRPVKPRPPLQPIFVAISGIGIFMFLIFLISFIPSKTHSAAPSPPESFKPAVSPTPPRKSDETDRPLTLDSSKIPTVSYCDLIKAAAIYDKKIVRVRAIYFNAFEKSYLYDERCETNQAPTAPEKVPAQMWAEWDKTLITKGDSDEAKLNRRLNGFGRRDITVVGRFHSTSEQGDANAPNFFGHMNCCRYQFSIMRTETVVELGEKPAAIKNAEGAKVKFAPHQKVEFADFTLEYYDDLSLLAAVPQPNRQLPKYAFKAERGNESVMIYGNGEPNDSTPLKFEFGAKTYLLELGMADKSGRLAKDELIVRRIS